MSSKFICRAEIDGMGAIDIYQDRRGVRLYGKSERLGQIPFQTKHGQQLLRDAVISAGFGEKIGEAPETPVEKTETKPEPSLGLVIERQEVKPETAPEKSGRFWGFGNFFKGSEA